MNKLTMIFTSTFAFLTAAAMSAHSMATTPAPAPLPRILPQSRLAVRCENGVCTTARLSRLSFAASRFPMPPDAGEAVDVAPPLPSNYDALLFWARGHYDPGVDAEEVLWNVRRAVADEPLLAGSFTEHVTRQVCIIWKESGGRHWAAGDGGNSLGCMQINRCHWRGMARADLNCRVEMHRVRWAQRMVAKRVAAGHTGWAAYSPWSVTRNSKAAAVKAAYKQLMEGV